MKKKVTAKSFNQEILHDRCLSLVHFRNEWNGACQIVSMIYDDVAKSYAGLANFYRINVEEESQLKKEYGVCEIPTILFFRAGKVVDYVIGLVPKNVLITKIENALSATYE